MTQSLLQNQDNERPALILPITCIACAYSFVLMVSGVLSFAGRMPMRLGAQLLGSGLEVMGPMPYFLLSAAYIAAAIGLLRRKNWARRLAIVLSAAGVVLLVPHISSTVVDERYAAMSLDGFQILIRVAIASYLFREADWFSGAREERT